jgi:hypothetical protein
VSDPALDRLVAALHDLANSAPASEREAQDTLNEALYRRRLAGPPTLDGVHDRNQVMAAHVQDGKHCRFDGHAWPCHTRADARGDYRPDRPVHDLDEALHVIAWHTERTGHCTACGEEWMCRTRRRARAVYRREGVPRPIPGEPEGG